MEKPPKRVITAADRERMVDGYRRLAHGLGVKHDRLAHDIMRRQNRGEDVPDKDFDEIDSLRRRMREYELKGSRALAKLPPEIAVKYQVPHKP
jgi:hypothetical protein